MRLIEKDETAMKKILSKIKEELTNPFGLKNDLVSLSDHEEADSKMLL